MLAVINGITVIALIMLIGWVARRFHGINQHAVSVMTDLVYWVLGPALLFSVISQADVNQVVGAPTIVAAISGIVTALVFVLISVVLMHSTQADLVIGAMSSSLSNAAYIGIPIAVFILGDAIHGVPIMIFQLGFFTPLYFVLIDLIASDRKPTVRAVVTTVITNPLVIAAAIGFVFCRWQLSVPTVIADATDMVGQAAPPVVLLAFGASLVGQRFSIHSHQSHVIVVASVLKLVVQPGVACLTGYLLGLEGHALMAVSVMGALPTAQNAFVATERAHTGESVAQGAVVITTVASLPITLLIAWLFSFIPSMM